jgi:hypothetical protein
MHIKTILNSSSESIKTAATIKTLFFACSPLWRVRIPHSTASETISTIKKVTNVKCCQDKKPSAWRV